ncbi:RagB/SusD family nutrient uptake outer membrane protein [Pedobacter sp. MC2016-14]|uniref:RagB/SusD family nutrient uptake outer membrane protein n=1 Tax=Pedobacter sp. MC2016-14 TaxID=2897327 RepID=UPI001E610C61|nr:RagB/SusD family nutrient uptake outer membrane protein [Pedobacter sp. MC2016-14]MCD0486830.1 RagB/SusD family nutrient uptake outer membrane protein [Pedobacter sp. MC2016-14]
MNRFNYYILFAALLVGSLTGCKKDFLSVVPKGKQVAKVTADYDLLMNGTDLYVNSYAGGWQAQALMGDDVAAEGTLFSKATSISQKTFRWDNDIYLSSENPFALQSFLEDIYLLNKVINEVMASPGGTEAQKKSILGEALACRAWIYFQLINVYGKPYEAGTAAADPGFPIIKTADITETGFKRNTIQEVYDFIVSDFTTAIADLPIQNKFPTRFSKPAAEGVLGKVYLFMHRNTDALGMFNAAFTHMAAQPVPARLYDYNVEFGPGGKFMPIGFAGPNNAPGQNTNDFTEGILTRINYNGPYSGNGLQNEFIVLSPKAVDLFEPLDLRLNFYAPFITSTMQPNPSGRLSKYAVRYSRIGLELPDLYLLRAEVKARLADLSGAKADVEALRNKRMLDGTVPAVVAADKMALLNFILDERVREFAAEGYRWFDMRRLYVDPLFTKPTYTHILYNDAVPNTTNISTFTLRPERLTMKIPPYIMDSNPQFTNNP